MRDGDRLWVLLGRVGALVARIEEIRELARAGRSRRPWRTDSGLRTQQERLRKGRRGRPGGGGGKAREGKALTERDWLR